MVRAKSSRVFEWFRRKYGEPTPAQAEAWPHIDAGEDVLVASPTGTGKTFAAFLGVIDALAQQHEVGRLDDSIHCIYVSPLRALGYDLEKNLNVPLRELFGEKPPIRVELRTGDSSGAVRARQQQTRRSSCPERGAARRSQPRAPSPAHWTLRNCRAALRGREISRRHE